jgi:hypothetical protein
MKPTNRRAIPLRGFTNGLVNTLTALSITATGSGSGGKAKPPLIFVGVLDYSIKVLLKE